MHKFAKFASVLDDMQQLDNVVVRLSSDSVRGETVPGKTTSTIIPVDDDIQFASYTICKAYTRDGKCGTCRACWSKDASVIAYPAHGKKMLKLIAVA